jgi:cytochrome c oxidase cbb3-type subunit 1
MSAIPSSSPSVVPTAAAIPPVAAAEIDASCRVPVLVLFACAAVWLVTASVLALIASLKFHMPQLLADCPWFTYGRLQPMQMNALIYGFAAQAALGVSLWMIARLGRTRLVQPGYVVVGALLWNLGMKIGIFGIQIGDSTGFDWLEMPGYASPILFVGYAIMGVCGLLTFHQRREPTLYVAQWFLLAALFWFPWIYSTANLLLVLFPVRGVLQASINWWYIGSLSGIWFGFIGLAVIFYFLPKLTGRMLYSNPLAMVAFWTLALFGGWGGIHHGVPLPAWIPSLSTVFTVLTLLPLLAIAINWNETLRGASLNWKASLPLRFVLFGSFAYLLAGALSIVDSLPQVSQTTHFTFFTTARTQLLLYGFFGMTMFGAIYYITPLLTRSEWPRANWANRHFTLGALGIALYVASLALGGVLQGRALNDPNRSFLDALNIGLIFFRVSTLGDVLMLAGNGLLALNLVVWLTRSCRACCVPAIVAAVKPQMAEVAR